ncbi:nascent polypeptide-associated complex subunit alpha, muscle-specific form [Austrofundulus limnaeus]|uniref:Nascent polypeptide-associated complex subunit alpha, muscle-specific form n=1 Tax=Austrofundulus limnaeus TaxID=52670 RepID=A0A2I4C491_AUSLI|nr:PREDICTED: nascent polypeptide-associated complex subunit alpha, muscle-specific form-like [Austrofundulus limnaeus]
MAIAYSTVTQLGLFSQQYPPPLLPKPGKDNVRLQKLLKRSAKKKASAQTSQTATTFRSSLSPVDEASPDQEHSDHSPSPRTPEITPSLYSIQPPPRFSVRPLYQHVASPYPQARANKIFPQLVTTPSQHASTVSSYSAMSQGPGGLTSTGQVAISSQPSSSLPEVTVTLNEFSTFPENYAGLKSATTVATVPSKSKVPGPTPFSILAGQNMVRPLIVLTPLIKSKSPRPTFKATEPSKSPKPMFDVPQIRMYTASTSYYETSRTPPVHGTAGLTSIGSTVPQSATLAETNPYLPLPSEIRRVKTPTHHLSLETNSGRITPISEMKRATPSSEIRGKPSTPVSLTAQATQAVFEISRQDSPLFTVSPVTVHPEKSSTHQTVSTISSSSTFQNVKPTEHPETLANGDIHPDVKPTAKPVEQGIKKSKSEPDLKRGSILTSVSCQRAETPTFMPSTQVVASYQRPKTPTYEASRLMTRSPGYKKPKTAPYGTSVYGVSQKVFQRPKTPVYQPSKTTDQEPTPAEHADSTPLAISVSVITTKDEVKANRELAVESMQEPCVKQQSTAEIFKEKDSSYNKKEPQQGSEPLAAAASVPTAVVSKRPDSSVPMPKKEAGILTGLVTAKQDTVIQEKQKIPTSVGRFLEKQNMETIIQETRPTAETSEPPPLKGGDQDPMKAVKMLLATDKGKTDTKKAVTETKADVSVHTKIVPPASDTKIKPKGTGSDSAAAAPAASIPATELAEDKEKQKKKETTEVPPAAESLLKATQKPKGLKSKMTGWSRLKKHMVVEQEEPKFPEIVSQKEVSEQDLSETRLEDKPGEKPSTQDEKQTEAAPKATKMWDAVLFQMFSSKENIMHQIELNKSEEEKKEDKMNESKEIPSFAYRLPVLLFSPRFDAKKLKEAASRPVTKISTVFEMGLIGRKGADEEPKDFNRTARGFTST